MRPLHGSVCDTYLFKIADVFKFTEHSKIVNGQVLVEKENHTGALPGTVLGGGNNTALQAAA